MKQTFKTIGLVIILTSMNTAMARAGERSDQDDIHWFSSSTSTLLNRSSVALGNNRIDRGVRFAYQALAGKLHPADEFIAYHNLCIGHLASGRAEDASQACAHAFELAQEPYAIIKVRGTLRLQGRNAKNSGRQEISSPAQVMVRNIQCQNTVVCLGLLPKGAPMLSDNEQPD